MKTAFDVVLVGAGSAGCAIASALCRNTSISVCLVEAGPDYGAYSIGGWPKELLDPRRRPTTHDWGYVEERAGGFVASKSRARIIGGCSTHNQCAAIWAPPEDYDAWASKGGDGWEYSEIQRLVNRVERNDESGSFRGRAGPIPTRRIVNKNYHRGKNCSWNLQ